MLRLNIQFEIIKGINNNRFKNANLQVVNFDKCIFNMNYVFSNDLTLTILYYRKFVKYSPL